MQGLRGPEFTAMLNNAGLVLPRYSCRKRYSFRCCHHTIEPANGHQLDEQYMRLALQQAQQAFDGGEVPVGAVLVYNGAIVSVAYNMTETRRNPLCHAEMLCIMEAAEKMQAWRLHDATLYSTLEPCPMCAGAILQARLKRLVYGARQPRIGADGSWVSLFPSENMQAVDRSTCEQTDQLNGIGQLPVVPDCRHPFHAGIQVSRGVLKQECRSIMIRFFKQRRQQPKAVKDRAAAMTTVSVM